MGAQKDFFDALDAGDFAAARELLLRKRVGVNARQEHGRHRGRTPLMAAVVNGDLDMVTALIEAGADVDACGTEHHSTALMLAAEEGKVRALHALLAHGAKTDTPDVYGRTAAHYAVLNHPEQALHLFKAGANFDLPDEDGLTARVLFETTAQVRSLERTMRELETLVASPPFAEPAAPVAGKDDGFAVAYFGHVHCERNDGEFLQSLGLATGQYDHDVGRFAVSVPGSLSVDVTQYLTAFKYDFELLPVSAALICSDPDKLDTKDRRALRAYLTYELATTDDCERIADLAARKEALDAAASITSSASESATTFDLSIASNEP
ncbi:ankyrin repeat domain-containing protein [Burkholderia cenocepacia]|uniref:ankyrin repeat domain-containing protein n=1 Tax=Burkholderia cenocepacia TaxID=95486 RepID=UPI001B8FFE75|nr:ankyrin repeat domain-containing protein [Burkholderia cenocepacia]MBR8426213.1 ankyrin repeat domain-containing protein [Burkholderia cenocepacia]